MPLSPDGIATCQACGVESQTEGEGIHRRWLSSSVSIWQKSVPGSRRGVRRDGSIGQKLLRPQFAPFMAEQPPCLIVPEAPGQCVSVRLDISRV